jgi:hypothetical protein
MSDKKMKDETVLTVNWNEISRLVKKKKIGGLTDEEVATLRLRMSLQSHFAVAVDEEKENEIVKEMHQLNSHYDCYRRDD